MNFQEEYYKYKKMYLDLKKISQSGGMILLLVPFQIVVFLNMVNQC